MASRVVVFLGKSKEYKEVRHRYRQRGIWYESERGYTLPVEAWFTAIEEHKSQKDSDPPSVIFVGTRDTIQSKDNALADVRNFLGEQCGRHAIGFVEVKASDLKGPNAGEPVTQQPFWRLFDQLRVLVAPEPIAESVAISVEGVGDDRARIRAAADTVVIDITHGYRAFPFLAAAALQMAQSESSRDELLDALPAPVESVRETRYAVLYAQLEEGEESAAVWDLSAVLRAQRWNAGIHALLKYGHAEEFAAACEADDRFYRKATNQQREQGQLDVPRPPSFRNLGRAAKTFADHIRYNRTTMILGINRESSAGKLEDAIDAAQSGLVAEIPILQSVLDRLKSMASRLKASSLYSAEGEKALYELARLQGHLGLGSNQGSMLRELILTMVMRRLGLRALEPGASPPKLDALSKSQDSCEGLRIAAEKNWNSYVDRWKKIRDKAPDAEDPAAVGFPIDISDQLYDLTERVQIPRNDVDHCGLNDRAIDIPELRNRFRGIIADVDPSPRSQ